MSRYKVPTSQFGKLGIDDKPTKPKRGSDVMPATTRSATQQQRRHAASSQASSSTPAGRYRSGSSSTSRQSAGPSNQQQRQRIDRGHTSENNEDDDDDDDDNRDDDENNDGNDDDEGNEPFTIGLIDRLRIAEVLAAMPNMSLTPVEVHSSLNSQDMSMWTERTRLIRLLGRSLLRVLSSQSLVDRFLNSFNIDGLDRTHILEAVMQNLTIRFENIRQQLGINIQSNVTTTQGRDVADTVTELASFQRVLRDFVIGYNSRGQLTGPLKEGLSKIVIDVLRFVVSCDTNLYMYTEAARIPSAGDTYGGNLYERWRDLGNREYLFQTLGGLRDHIRQTNARQPDRTLIWVYDSLSTKNDVVWSDFNNLQLTS